jgi:uncharacterized coiled-coil protein SlyX
LEFRRIRDLESRAKWRETRNDETLYRLESEIAQQREEIRQLEEVVFKLANRRSRNSSDVQAMVDIIKARRASVSRNPLGKTPPQSPVYGGRLSPTSPKRSRSK